jgi:NitT/TauT family transport system substrate-binding protein
VNYQVPLLILLIFFLLPARGGAVDLKVGQIFSASQSPTWVARESGYFEKNGLQIELIAFKSGPTATQALIAHDIDILTAGGVEVINADLQGANMVFVAQNVGTFPYTLYVGKHIKNAQALKGGKLAISSFGGPSEFLTRYAVQRLGLDPQQDVTLVQVGTQRFSALASGSVDGAMIQPPDTLKAREIGLKPLLDLSDSGLKFPFNNITTRKDILAGNRPKVVNFLKAYVAGLARFHMDRSFTLQVLKKYLRTDEEAVLADTYQFWNKLFPKKPYFEREGVETYFEMAKKGNASPEQFFDNSLIAEIDKQGFIDALYAPSR